MDLITTSMFIVRLREDGLTIVDVKVYPKNLWNMIELINAYAEGYSIQIIGT